ncbi:hypothetical protein L1987_21939 [Smallanthus sonchifolius]|uniref:Uncharacterized protein n=1 Tax=Smallanthus sonchifolius TaxID=185202 RepID=A0ACB9ICT2_9ASTR|nr:hypothetical protein L1987_21939 [Smallanthus sonchifolius]
MKRLENRARTNLNPETTGLEGSSSSHGANGQPISVHKLPGKKGIDVVLNDESKRETLLLRVLVTNNVSWGNKAIYTDPGYGYGFLKHEDDSKEEFEFSSCGFLHSLRGNGQKSEAISSIGFSGKAILYIP